MSQVFRRFYSSASNASASEAAAEILQRFGPNKPISFREQVLDANQLRFLTLTLGRPSLHAGGSKATDAAPKSGTPVPPGYHLCYFLPAFLEQDLGKDGTDKTLNPLSPWTRRMWAGGELEWTQDPRNILRVGQNVKETTRVTSAQAKETKAGGSLIIAGLEKTFENEHGVALVDRRNWVFQKEITEARQPPPKPEEKAFPNARHVRDHTQTDTTLFRFSALTFNAHKIHVNRDWCRQVEGHRDLVVHGPINLLAILDLFRDVTARGPEYVPKSLTYRAQSPFYVGETARILLDEEEQNGQGTGKWKAEVVDSFGKTGVKSTIDEGR